MEMPTAVSHCHRFARVSFPLAIFEGSGFCPVSWAKISGECPQPKLQGLCQRLDAVFWLFLRSLTNSAGCEQVNLKEPSISLTAI
jgi:hypothetical protein